MGANKMTFKSENLQNFKRGQSEWLFTAFSPITINRNCQVLKATQLFEKAN